MFISNNMKIDIRQIRAAGTDFRFTGSAEEMDIAVPGVKFPSPIEVELVATFAGDEIICQGEVFSEVEAECSRCLEPFDLVVEGALSFVVQLVDTLVELNSYDEDFEIVPKTQTFLDISARVRDAIVLNIAMKPLCGEDCRGLCPMCGTNLNEGTCDCMPDKADERWDALKSLFDNQIE